MKHIRRQLENILYGIVEDIKFFDVRGEFDRVASLEAYADDIKDQLDILARIEKEGEGNLVRFDNDDTFRLWCIRIPEGGEQIIEYYDTSLQFKNYDELIETAECINVTDVFDLKAYPHDIIVVDNIDDCIRKGVYYLVTNDAMDVMRGC